MLARASRCVRCTCGATFGLRDHYCTEVGATRTLRFTRVIVISTVKPDGSSVDHSFICLVVSHNFIICHKNKHCNGRMFVEMSPRDRHFCSYYKRFIWVRLNVAPTDGNACLLILFMCQAGDRSRSA